MSYLPTGGGVYILASSIGSTDSTISLTSFTEPVSGTAYTMANIGTDIVYATIAPKTTSSEFISFTGITQNADGTATLTGVTRGLSRSTPFTSSVTFKLPHSGQSQLILSNSPQQINEYVTLRNAETISGVKTFSVFPVTPSSAPSTSYQVANKKYVDDTASFGAPDASTTVKGIVKMSVAPASVTEPIAVGSNDPKVSPVSLASLTANQVGALVGTDGTPTALNPYVTNGTATATYQTLANIDTTTTLGTSNTKYSSQNAVKTYVDNQTLVCKTGNLTKDMSSDTTTTIAHGLGRIPKLVRFHVNRNKTSGAGVGSDDVYSIGSYDGTTNNCNYLAWDGNGSVTAVLQDTTHAIHFGYIASGSGADTANLAGAVTFDATNITIAWTKTGSPTGTGNIIWDAIG